MINSTSCREDNSFQSYMVHEHHKLKKRLAMELFTIKEYLTNDDDDYDGNDDNHTDNDVLITNSDSGAMDLSMDMNANESKSNTHNSQTLSDFIPCGGNFTNKDDSMSICSSSSTSTNGSSSSSNMLMDYPISESGSVLNSEQKQIIPLPAMLEWFWKKTNTMYRFHVLYVDQDYIHFPRGKHKRSGYDTQYSEIQPHVLIRLSPELLPSHRTDLLQENNNGIDIVPFLSMATQSMTQNYEYCLKPQFELKSMDGSIHYGRFDKLLTDNNIRFVNPYIGWKQRNDMLRDIVNRATEILNGLMPVDRSGIENTHILTSKTDTRRSLRKSTIWSKRIINMMRYLQSNGIYSKEFPCSL